MKVKRSIKSRIISTIMVAAIAFSVTITNTAFAENVVSTFHGYTGVITLGKNWMGLNVFSGSTTSPTIVRAISISLIDNSGIVSGQSFNNAKSATCSYVLNGGSPYGVNYVMNNAGTTFTWYTNHAYQ